MEAPPLISMSAINGLGESRSATGNDTRIARLDSRYFEEHCAPVPFVVEAWKAPWQLAVCRRRWEEQTTWTWQFQLSEPSVGCLRNSERGGPLYKVPFSQSYRQARRPLRADHPSVGLVLDTFHILAGKCGGMLGTMTLPPAVLGHSGHCWRLPRRCMRSRCEHTAITRQAAQARWQ